MKWYTYTLVFLCLLSYKTGNSQISSGSLKIIVTDTFSKEFIPYANVILLKNDSMVDGKATDFDGFAFFSNLDPGNYQIEVSYVGYSAFKSKLITISPNNITIILAELKEGLVADEVSVVEYRKDIISESYGGSTKRTSSEISKSPTRSINQIVGLSGGVQTTSGSAPVVKGARSSANITYIDGMPVRGNSAVPISSYEPLKKRKEKLELPNTEMYVQTKEQSFYNPYEKPLSTFSIDVDEASYTNARRYITNGQTPPPESIRIEEFINYFQYEYDAPTNGEPFAVHSEISQCPWNEKNLLLKIALKGRVEETENLPNSNLVFLIDVSGSMSSPNKLSLLKDAFVKMTKHLSENDKVSIVVYAGASGVVLDGVAGNNHQIISKAIHRLESGGSTAGYAGITTAYDIAEKHFIPNGNNRIILATDGDFNVGLSGLDELEKMITEKRKSGIMFSSMGFGMGNYADARLELLANKGNGAYYYIDTKKEANRVFSEKIKSTLFTIAKDVKLQLEFNPQKVKSYRLVGYENRALKDEDFANDTIDAGELGVGHTVTAFYEIVPLHKIQDNVVQKLRYQTTIANSNDSIKDEWLTLKLRYKNPNENVSKLISHHISCKAVEFNNSSSNFQFSSLVAASAMLMRNSNYLNNANKEEIKKQLNSLSIPKSDSEKREFISLFKQYCSLH